MALLHILILHKAGGSRHPLGLSHYQQITFSQYLLYKDHTLVIITLLIYVNFVFFEPNYFGEKINFLRANPNFTPKHIVPE
jgi:quinol-cytochrome oxidoreductase complex cytochrome b subunit